MPGKPASNNCVHKTKDVHVTVVRKYFSQHTRQSIYNQACYSNYKYIYAYTHFTYLVHTTIEFNAAGSSVSATYKALLSTVHTRLNVFCSSSVWCTRACNNYETHKAPH